MKKTRTGLLIAFGFAVTGASIHAAAPNTLVNRVVVLRNTNSPISTAIANDYMARRGVTHVLDITCQDAAVNTDSETITFKKYLAVIDAPLRNYLDANPGVDFIVMTKGIPIRLLGSEEGNWKKADSEAQYHSSSLDSYVAAFGYDTIVGTVRITVQDTPNYGANFYGVSWSNRFWNSKQTFSHAAFGGYLVTRLDAYTQAEAVGLTTKSLAADSARLTGKTPAGKILLDECQDFGTTSVSAQPYSIVKSDPPVRDTSHILRESTWGDYNSDMELAHDTLKARKIPDSLNTNNTFVGGMTGLMGYISWGSNDSHYQASAYLSLGFGIGGIGETAVSTSARTFLPTSGGQSLVTDLIHQGITGMKGYVDEPFLQACASPSILYSRYTSGWTLAESYYAASNEVGWEDIVIGDPILQAYPITDPAGINTSEPLHSEVVPSVNQINNRMVFSIPMLTGFSQPTVIISTLQGKVVKTLRSQNTGSDNQLIWDLNDGARNQTGPGIYVYRISMSNQNRIVSFQGRFRIAR